MTQEQSSELLLSDQVSSSSVLMTWIKLILCISILFNGSSVSSLLVSRIPSLQKTKMKELQSLISSSLYHYIKMSAVPFSKDISSCFLSYFVHRFSLVTRRLIWQNGDSSWLDLKEVLNQNRIRLTGSMISNGVRFMSNFTQCLNYQPSRELTIISLNSIKNSRRSSMHRKLILKKCQENGKRNWIVSKK